MLVREILKTQSFQRGKASRRRGNIYESYAAEFQHHKRAAGVKAARKDVLILGIIISSVTKFGMSRLIHFDERSIRVESRQL
ncbi:hypothetical protein DY000_02001668 [Brassica cretica]|uniref:Transposase n=1 Tax=Brassica cretica TaxID=69181 RepID=A0ABQ7C6H0_BRACR|nr:hypothetical protein DY000_02001668 [Brassica cretica]